MKVSICDAVSYIDENRQINNEPLQICTNQVS